MSKVGRIRDEESESGVRMMRGLLVVELFSKSYFVDVVVAGLLVVELFSKSYFVDVVVATP
jgi:hypothetical protein